MYFSIIMNLDAEVLLQYLGFWDEPVVNVSF